MTTTGSAGACWREGTAGVSPPIPPSSAATAAAAALRRWCLSMALCSASKRDSSASPPPGESPRLSTTCIGLAMRAPESLLLLLVRTRLGRSGVPLAEPLWAGGRGDANSDEGVEAPAPPPAPPPDPTAAGVAAGVPMAVALLPAPLAPLLLSSTAPPAELGKAPVREPSRRRTRRSLRTQRSAASISEASI